MTINPFHVAFMLLTMIVCFSTCSSNPTPSRPATAVTPPPVKADAHNKDFHWDNESLIDILRELEESYDVKICNPKQVVGVPITGLIPKKGKSISEMCSIVNRVEIGHAYLLYQNGVVFVSGTAFPAKFVPDKMDWPCY